MGSFRYGANNAAELDDRVLAHVQLLIAAKLRKREGFMLSWTVEPEHGSGRVSIWVDEGIPLSFRFDGSRTPLINRAWLNHMIDQSYSVPGTEITSEADFEAHVAAQQTAADAPVAGN
ncbi:hypothetical protein [Plantibacter sp. YIM 135347]|uniref:DUF7882 family protein n=1 Tax=Plantibacter sp. YIM 135347 TaxID=3423919 RepID=UPI003D34C4E7